MEFVGLCVRFLAMQIGPVFDDGVNVWMLIGCAIEPAMKFLEAQTVR